MKNRKQTIWQYINSEDSYFWEEHDPIETKMIKYRLWSIVYEFNELESLLEIAICDLIHEREHTSWMVVISGMSFNQKIWVLKRLLLSKSKISENKKLYH